MASMKRPRLKAEQPRSGASLELTFTNAQHFTLDMSDALKAYPGLAPLSKRKAFEGVILGDGGWSVEWPALDFQIGADTLLLDALAQNAFAAPGDARSGCRSAGSQRPKHQSF